MNDETNQNVFNSQKSEVDEWDELANDYAWFNYVGYAS